MLLLALALALTLAPSPNPNPNADPDPNPNPNQVTAHVMLLLTGMLQLGKAGSAHQSMDADSQEIWGDIGRYREI